MLYHMSGYEIAQAFRKGDVSAVQIAQAFLKRIEECDPHIKAFLHVCSQRALDKAQQLDEKKAQGQPLGKLAAVPIAIKDNIHIQTLPTTCASKILGEFKAPFSASAVERLECEGALLMGKVNMDEFGMGSSTENSAFFPSKNPWNLICTPGGSSGGSAAAVAARLVPIALGSDTGGSIRQPAAFCGIYGFKPSYGRVSRWGLVAFASSLDVVGPLAHDIRDICTVMEVIGQPCHYDSTCLNVPADDYAQDSAGNLNSMRIGIPFQFLDALNQEAKEQFLSRIQQLKEQGVQVIEVNLDILRHSLAVYYIIATAEAATNLARFDGIRYGIRNQKATTLDEVYRLSREEGFGTEVKRRILMGNFSLSSDQQDAFFKKAQKVRQLIIDQYNEAFESCDLICLPTTPNTAFELGAITDPLQMYLGDIYTTSVNLAALPAISLPTGFDHKGLPWGLQLIGRHSDDRRVVQAAQKMSDVFSDTVRIPSGY